MPFGQAAETSSSHGVGQGLSPVTSSPSSRTLPLIGLIRPDAVRKVVVLPAPFGPRSATTPESGTERETSHRTTVSP